MSLLVLPDLFIRHPMVKSVVSAVPAANVAVSFAGLIYPAPDGEVGSVGSTGSQCRC